MLSPAKTAQICLSPYDASNLRRDSHMAAAWPVSSHCHPPWGHVPAASDLSPMPPCFVLEQWPATTKLYRNKYPDRKPLTSPLPTPRQQLTLTSAWVMTSLPIYVPMYVTPPPKKKEEEGITKDGNDDFGLLGWVRDAYSPKALSDVPRSLPPGPFNPCQSTKRQGPASLGYPKEHCRQPWRCLPVTFAPQC